MLMRLIEILVLPVLLTACVTYSRPSEAVDIKTYIPDQAPPMMELVKEQLHYWPDMPTPWYMGGLMEQESCISLTHSKCFNRLSKLSTKRELGGGVLQLTKTYQSNGVVRFDSLAEMRNKHRAELKDLSWNTLWDRPDLQVRAGLLMTEDNYKALYSIDTPEARLNMVDAAYNGGLGGLYKDRRLCGLKVKCDPDLWWGNVALTCSKSKKPLYGDRNACDINREHVFNVFRLRMPKYKVFFNPQKQL